jgi:hypothetical protein
METTSFTPPPPPPAFYIDETIRGSLDDAARWARFLAIIGFICIVLAILGSIFCGLFMNSFMHNWGYRQNMPAAPPFPGTVISVLYIIVMAVLYFFPCLYLIRFGVKTRQALRSNDLSDMRNAFVNLHFFYRFIGILTIIWLIIGLLTIIGIIIGISMGGMNRF